MSIIGQQPVDPNVISHRLNSWTLETRIANKVDAASVVSAASDYLTLMNGLHPDHGLLWVLDASDASDFEFEALPSIQENVKILKPVGLDRLAFILTGKAVPFAGFIESSFQGTGVSVFFFGSRQEVLAWIKRRCR